MTEFSHKTLITNKFAQYLKRGDIINWGDKRDLIIDECSSHEYPLLALRRVGENSGKISFQVINYRVDPIFKDDLQFYYGPVIRAEQQELYKKAEEKMAAAGITNTTERKSIEDDWRRAKSELDLFRFLDKRD